MEVLREEEALTKWNLAETYDRAPPHPVQNHKSKETILFY